MKKKGLIIATIVMVLVLAVSLTTATYAWFTNEGTAKVDAINFSVKSAADVMIGVASANTYDSTKTLTNFVSGGTSFNDGTWTGGSGLGLEVNHNIELKMSQAIYSFHDIQTGQHTNVYFATSTEGAEGAKSGSAIKTQYTFVAGTAIQDANYYVTCDSSSSEGYSFTAFKTSETPFQVGVQDVYDTSSADNIQTANVATAITTGIDHGTTGHKIMKASGEGTVITTGTLTDTTVNSDYVDIAFGALASNPQLLGYGMVVHIRPTDTKSTLGVNAAIHVAYNKNNTGWVEYDIYGTNDRNTVKEEMSLPTIPSWDDTQDTPVTHTYSATIEGSVLNGLQKGDALLYIPLYESADGTTCAPTTAANLQQVQLVVYLCGPDEDCITASTGVSAVLTVEFISLQKQGSNG